MEVMVSPRVITRLFAVIIVGLALAHLTGQVFHLYFGHDYVLGFVPLFNLDGERNIPALFTALLLYLCSMLLGLIAYAQKKAGALYRYWLGLAFIFLFLALDEAAELHEMLIVPLRLMLDPSGFFYLAWVIPYGIGLFFLLVYLRFFIRLPMQTRWLFLTAGLIYVAGILGLELVGGRQLDLTGEQRTVMYVALGAVEELLEMVGIVVFMYALMSYIAVEVATLRLGIAASGIPTPVNEGSSRRVVDGQF